MKKIMLFISFCVFTFLTNYAQEKVSTDNISALKFQTIDEFKKFIETNSTEGLANINGFGKFETLKSTFPAEAKAPEEINQDQKDDDYDIKEDKLPIFDKNDYSNNYLLGDLLNTDKVVVIGNWIIKIDLENDRALLLNTKFADQYKDLVNANTENVNVLSYPLDSDGLEILELLDDPKADQGEMQMRCRTVKQQGTSEYAYNGNRKRLRMEMGCQNLFFYHSLVVKSHTQKRLFGIWWHHYAGSASIPNMLLVYNIRCGNGCSQFSGPPSCGGGSYQQGDVCVYRPYSGWKRLSNYDFSVDFNSTNGNGHIELHDN
jgi:hypothetical protein